MLTQGGVGSRRWPAKGVEGGTHVSDNSRTGRALGRRRGAQCENAVPRSHAGQRGSSPAGESDPGREWGPRSAGELREKRRVRAYGSTATLTVGGNARTQPREAWRNTCYSCFPSVLCPAPCPLKLSALRRARVGSSVFSNQQAGVNTPEIAVSAGGTDVCGAQPCVPLSPSVQSPAGRL